MASDSSLFTCNQRACLNAKACKLRQTIPDWRHNEELLQCVRTFHLCDANADGRNIETDGDIGIGAGCLVRWLYAQPGDCSGCQLHERMRSTKLTCRALTKYLYLCLQVGANAPLNDCPCLVSHSVQGSDIRRT